MSIDKNVGAISRFMNKGITNPIYNKVKKDIKTLFGILSTNDINLIDLTKRATQAVKDFFMAGSLFEAFGFRYIGPINGHDLDELVETFKNISTSIDDDEESASPVLIHVITKKGKGYAPAEDDPSSFHGVSAFCPTIKKVEPDGTKYVPTYTEVFGATLCKMMTEDKKIVAITAAMPSGTGLDHIKNVYPDRYYDAGIAESHAVVFSAGLASKGFRPVVAIYSTFLQRAFDNIIHDVCLQNIPVVFAIDRAGVVGEDGATHHGVFDLSYLRHIPNLVVMSPKNEAELVSMLKFAVDLKKPCAVRYPRGKGVGVSLDNVACDIELGKSEIIVERQTAKYSIFAIGNMVENARKASEILSSKNIVASVFNMRFEKPIDETAILNEAKKGRTIITIEDNVLAGGFGSAILEVLSNNNFGNTKVLRLGYPDEFVEHAKIGELHDKYDLTPEKIALRIEKINL